jgi:hypothetical protein
VPERLQFEPAERAQSAQVRVARVAERQWGVVARSQLERCGLSGSAISRWAAQGRLHRIHRGVYAVGHPLLDDRGRAAAALLYAGPGAALSHQTAGWWWRMIDAIPQRIHVISPRRAPSLPEICVHTRSDRQDVRHHGLPVTTPSQTLLDLASTLPFADLRRALAEADYRGLLEPAAIEHLTGRGRPGSAALGRAVSLHLPHLAETRSLLERRFLLLVERTGLPIPEMNAIVEGLMVDALWREAGVVVELDGHRAHARAAASERDRGRELALRAAGFTVLRYTWQQVSRECAAVIADLRAALERRPA